MAERPEASTTQPLVALPQADLQKRHTVAALVYFAYGVFYLFGAQYLTSMQATARGMSNPGLFFFLGGVLTILFPLLIYSRFALALSLQWPAHRTTLFVNFTLLLGLLVVARVVALLRGGLYAKTPWHTAALLIAAINAACLLWAGLGRPAWITREPQGRAAEPPSAHAVAEGRGRGAPSADAVAEGRGRGAPSADAVAEGRGRGAPSADAVAEGADDHAPD